MSVLTAAQTAGIRIKSEAPISLFSSPTKFATELANLATEVAISIMKAHDWRRLTLLQTVTGDGSDTSFALPTDYDRMPQGAKVYSSSSYMALRPVRDVNQWLEFQIDPVVGDPGFWIVLGNEFHIKPALGNGNTAKFYYISNKCVTGGTKAAFSADADTFDIGGDRLITLGLVYRWKELKGLDFALDEENYKTALMQEIGRDKGARTLYIGQPRYSSGVNVAYPGEINPS
jgi:hypothetical protein